MVACVRRRREYQCVSDVCGYDVVARCRVSHSSGKQCVRRERETSEGASMYGVTGNVWPRRGVLFNDVAVCGNI